MAIFNFTQPQFLLCEIPIKDGSQNDNRLWVYHRLSLSLIEFINVDAFKYFEFKGTQERFEYDNGDFIENWFGVFVQNNCEATDNDSQKVLQKAWEFLEIYLHWEDTNINN